MNENTTGGPLTATVGEQLGEKGHLDQVHEAEKRVAGAAGAGAQRAGVGRGRRGGQFPWVPLAAAAAGWLLVRSVARGIGRRLRRRRR